MKKLYYILIAGLLAAVSCQQKEIVENPQFGAYNDNDEPVLVYGQSIETALEFGYFQYSKTANNNNEVAKTSFFRVKSNCAWKIVSEGNAPDWVRPYPEEGDKDGFFGFFLDRNNDQNSDRSAIFKVTLNNGEEDIPVGGYIIITQSKAVDFLKVNVAKIEVNKEGGKSSVTITSNVPWTFTLTPDEGYASPAIDQWITDISEPTEGNTRTLKFQFADNSDGSIRGATLDIKATGHDDLSKSIPVTQYGVELEVAGFPVSWPGAAGNNSYPLWPSATNAVPTINSTEGKGTITFIRADVPGVDRTNSTTDCSGSNPRVNGAWPGDYWQFTAPTAVSAGSLIKLQFEARISAGGMRLWRLEYLDGTEWKVAGKALTADIPEGGGWPAETVTYTHDMAPGGSGDEFNKVITAVVRYENTTPECSFRFVVAVNVTGKDARLAKPDTGSTRLDNSGGETGCDASISCVASGGEIRYADIEISGLDKDYILFEGTPSAPATFTVEASDDFTVTTTADWLTVTQGATGLAGEATPVEITCAPSSETKSREAQIIVTAGVTRKYIAVIQGAAGGNLNPLISISTGNAKNVDSDAGDFIVEVQANTEVSVKSSDWLTVTALDTKSIVEAKSYKVEYAKNEAPTQRVGTVTFYNETEGIESVLTVTQGAAQLIYYKDDFEWLAQWTNVVSTPDDIKANSVGSAPNVFTKAGLEDFMEAFKTRGYTYIWGWKGQDWSDGDPDNGNKQTLYLQKNYLKFGKTDYSSGIILPALTKIDGTADVELTFDWCWCMTGGSKADLTTLTVVVTGGGTIAATGTDTSSPIVSGQPNEGADNLTKLEWQHVSVRINGATSATRITIRPTYSDPTVDNPARRQQRWYLDNIMIVPPTE